MNRSLTTLNLAAFLAIFMVSIQSSAQLTVEFQILTVLSDVDDMDAAGGSGANGGDSDPRFDYKIDDVPFVNTGNANSFYLETNCLGSQSVNNVFFSATYSGCDLPTEFVFDWQGYEKDGSAPTSDAYATDTITIPWGSLTVPQPAWTTYGTYTKTAPGLNCSAGALVTWEVVLQYRITGTASDVTPPVISCPGNLTVGNDAGLCGAIVNFTPPIGTDNCPGAVTTLIAGQTTGTQFPIGTTTVSYEVVDASSNTAFCSFDITVNDTEPPAISCPGNQNVNNDAGICGATITYPVPVGTDNCPGSSTTMTAGLANGALFPIGTTTVTYQVVDAASASNQCSFDITVTDSELPSITCPPNQSVNNDIGICGATITYAAPVGTDNCAGSSTILQSGLTSGSLFPIGTSTVSYQVTDAALNTASCSFDVSVTDSENPTIICPADVTVNNITNLCSAIANYTAPVGIDNCAGATTTMTAGLVSGALFNVGTTVQTFEVVDASGNTASCSFNVIINDIQSPTISCPANISVNNDAGTCGALVNYAAVTVNDNCAGFSSSLLSGLPSGSTFPLGTTSVIFEAVDASLNTAQCSFDVTVTDSEVPTISCPSNITANNTPGLCGATITYSVPVFNDNCAGSTLTMMAGQASGSVFPVGTTTVTFQVTDASTNTAQCSFDVNIIDNEIPTITCPANISVNNDPAVCEAIVNYSAPVFTDNCPGSSISMIAGLASGGTFPLGVSTVTYEVVDASANTAQCSFDVEVIDNELPQITCPAPITVNNALGQCGSSVIYTAPIGTDNCTGSVTSLTAGLGSGNVFPVGTTTVTYQVVDGSSNSAQCSFDVVVNDIEAPSIACPPNITANNDAGICGALVNYGVPTIADNCTGLTFSVISGMPSGSTFPVGLSTVTYEVVDASFNTAQCSFDITVNDNENPVITCPTNFTVNNDLGSCSAVVNYGLAVFTDNCAGGSVAVTAGLASGSTFPLGMSSVTYEAQDASGNTSTCSFDITIIDAENPAITCPTNISVNNDIGLCGAAVNYLAPVGTDNCPGQSTTIFTGLGSGSTFPVGTSTEIFEVVDAAGNTAQCSFDITVIDTELPSITCPGNITLNNDAGICGGTVSFAAPLTADNCPGSSATLISGFNSGSLFPIGTTTNTFEVIDAASNTAQCSFDVTIIDTELPTIICPTNISVNNDIGSCDAVVSFTAPVGIDNCPGPSTTLFAGMTSGSTFPIGVSTVSYEVMDAAGNSAQCSFDIEVIDAELPSITCPTNLTLNSGAGCGTTVFYTAPVGTDNCVGSTTSLITGLSSGSFFTGGLTTVTYEVVDLAGNSSQCSFDITVVDQDPPTITCPANMTVTNDMGICGAVVNYPAPTVTDNCMGWTVNLMGGFASGAQFPIGTTTVGLMVIDVSGNSAQCSFDVTVEDLEAPVLACPANQTVTANANCEFVLLDYTSMATATDNCGSVVVTQSPPAGTLSSTSETVTITANDQYGNTSTCTFDVNADDNIAPVLTCPSNDTVYMSQLCDYTFTDLINVIGIVENCNTYTYTQDPAVGVTVLSDTVVTFEVTDAAGNMSSCQVNLAVVDSTPPIVTCPANDLEVFFSSICDFAIQDYSSSISTFDNCGPVTLTQSPAPGVAITGNTPIIITGFDINGNSQQCSFTVIPKDTVPPTMGCPGNQTLYLDNNCETVVPDYTALAVIQTTCEIITVTQTPVPGTVITSDISLAFAGVDATGNTSFCSFQVFAVDTVAPKFICPGDIYSCDPKVLYVDPVVSDNCGVYSSNRITGPAPGSTFPLGSTLIEYVAEDDFGNTDTCGFYIHINPVPTMYNGTTDVTCYRGADGQIEVDVVGGTAPYSYSWSHGATTEDVSDLDTGNYVCVVVDANGCTDTTDATIYEPAPLVIDTDVLDAGCYGENNGHIFLFVNGGTAPYVIDWSPAVGVVNKANDLGPGQYSILVEDGNGCDWDTVITINGIDTMSFETTVSEYDFGWNISEQDGTDGWVDIVVSGGSAPYYYDWSHGDMTAYIDNLTAGTYEVIITDDEGCEDTLEFTLNQPLILDAANAMSPNGDGMNDRFIIENIEHFPNSELRIMNRWGDVVYEMIGYQNDWEGESKNGVVFYGDKVPEGSYFYTVDLKDDRYENLSGYLIINR
jgi:gliding motility-associated-like protein